MLESVWVIVPASAGGVVLGTVAVVVPVPGVVVVVPVFVVVVDVDGVVKVADGVVAEPPARLSAAPQAPMVPVFVRSTSVTINVCAAGTVNAVTAVVPAGTCRVISTTLRTVGVVPVDVVPVAAAIGSALGDEMVVGASGDVVVVAEEPGASVVVAPVPMVDVWADSWLVAVSATRAHRHSASTVTSFMRTSCNGTGPAGSNAGASELLEWTDEFQPVESQPSGGR